MRKLLVVLMLLSIGAEAQTITGNKAFIRALLKLNGYSVTHFDNDTLMAANSVARLPTQYAVRKYVKNNGGGLPAGATTQVQFNDGGVFGASSRLAFDKTSGTLTVQGAGTTSATSSVVAKDGSGNTMLSVKNNGVVEVGKQTDAATQNTAVIKSVGSDADIGLALMPKGNGAITAQVPDGTVTGGNARGQYAVDLQMFRAANTQVASAESSTVAGGYGNTASAQNSTVAGGRGNTASGQFSTVAGGFNSTASAQHSFATNTENYATGIASSAFGRQAKAYMYGQHSIGVNVGINTFGHGQATMLPMAQNSTGTSDFFVKAGHDFAAGEGTGNNFNPDGTNRIIRATLQVAIVCNDKGNSGTLTTGDAYTSDITFAVQKVSNNISILGTVDEEKVKASAAMSSLVINVSADNATKEVKIEVTPPSGTGSTTKFRAVATLRCTEVAW